MEALVVEDEALVRMLVVDILEAAGLRVVEAGDAESALDILSARGAPFPVLVTDINLGSGMNGIELADTVLRCWPEQAVVYVTANADLLDGRPLGPRQRVVAKPFEVAALVAAVQQVLAATPPTEVAAQLASC
jgi:CheY-like chemotaxis protein